MNYKMVVEIPINNVPDNISIQEAKVTSEVWLLTKIPDAKLVKFEKANNTPEKP